MNECKQRCMDGTPVCTGCAPAYHLNKEKTACERKYTLYLYCGFPLLIVVLLVRRNAVNTDNWGDIPKKLFCIDSLFMNLFI